MTILRHLRWPAAAALVVSMFGMSVALLSLEEVSMASKPRYAAYLPFVWFGVFAYYAPASLAHRKLHARVWPMVLVVWWLFGWLPSYYIALGGCLLLLTAVMKHGWFLIIPADLIVHNLCVWTNATAFLAYASALLYLAARSLHRRLKVVKS